MGKILDNLNEKFSSSGNLISESIKNIDLNSVIGDNGGESKPLYPVVKIIVDENNTSTVEFIEGIIPLDAKNVELICIKEYNSGYAELAPTVLCYMQDEETYESILSSVFVGNNPSFELELSQDKKSIIGIKKSGTLRVQFVVSSQDTVQANFIKKFYSNELIKQTSLQTGASEYDVQTFDEINGSSVYGYSNSFYSFLSENGDVGYFNMSNESIQLSENDWVWVKDI